MKTWVHFWPISVTNCHKLIGTKLQKKREVRVITVSCESYSFQHNLRSNIS